MFKVQGHHIVIYNNGNKLQIHHIRRAITEKNHSCYHSFPTEIQDFFIQVDCPRPFIGVSPATDGNLSSG